MLKADWQITEQVQRIADTLHQQISHERAASLGNCGVKLCRKSTSARTTRKLPGLECHIYGTTPFADPRTMGTRTSSVPDLQQERDRNGNRQATANAWLSDLLDMDHGPIWRVPKRGRGLEKSPVRKLWDLGHHQRRMHREENGQQTEMQCPLQRDCANHHQGDDGLRTQTTVGRQMEVIQM